MIKVPVINTVLGFSTTISISYMLLFLINTVVRCTYAPLPSVPQPHNTASSPMRIVLINNGLVFIDSE